MIRARPITEYLAARLLAALLAAGGLLTGFAVVHAQPQIPGPCADMGTTMAMNRPELALRSSGPAVCELQMLLGRHGQTVTVDGEFGCETDSAVRTFQTAKGLAVDGVVGSQTWIALLQPPATGAGTATVRPELRMGACGPAVALLQTLLTERGHPVTSDGEFGSQTDKAVRAFQRERRLDVDGIVGPQTWAALMPPAAGTGAGTGSSGSYCEPGKPVPPGGCGGVSLSRDPRPGEAPDPGPVPSLRAPDLTVQRAAFGEPGSNAPLLQVRNDGPSAAGAFTVRIQVGERIITEQIAGLQADTSTFIGQPPAYFCERAVVMVDPDNMVRESNEANNRLEYFGPGGGICAR
jgi:peptidoglycan hydrolase-like protein with peptidoglycan-binding domain